MRKPEDKDTRYYIELDLESEQILYWDYGNRFTLFHEKPAHPFHHRVYISKGQYNKLVQKHLEVHSKLDM